MGAPTLKSLAAVLPYGSIIDLPAQASRSQTRIVIMIEKSTAFHPRLTGAGQELFDFNQKTACCCQIPTGATRRGQPIKPMDYAAAAAKTEGLGSKFAGKTWSST
jgi:hypothetical protein